MNEVVIFVLGSLMPYFLRLIEAVVVYMKRELDKESKDA